MKGKKGKKNKATNKKGEIIEAQEGEVNMGEPPALKK